MAQNITQKSNYWYTLYTKGYATREKYSADELIQKYKLADISNETLPDNIVPYLEDYLVYNYTISPEQIQIYEKCKSTDYLNTIKKCIIAFIWISIISSIITAIVSSVH